MGQLGSYESVLKKRRIEYKKLADSFLNLEGKIAKLKEKQRKIQEKVIQLSGYRTGTRESTQLLHHGANATNATKSKTVFVNKIEAMPYAYLGVDSVREHSELSWNLRLKGSNIKADGNVGRQNDYFHVHI